MFQKKHELKEWQYCLVAAYLKMSKYNLMKYVNEPKYGSESTRQAINTAIDKCKAVNFKFTL